MTAELAEVRRLRLEPGDLVVVSSSTILTGRQLHVLRDQLEERFPDNDVLVLNGCDIAVAKSAEHV